MVGFLDFLSETDYLCIVKRNVMILCFDKIDYSKISKYQKYFKEDIWGFFRFPPEKSGLRETLYFSNSVEHSKPLRVYLKTTDDILVPFRLTKEKVYICDYENRNIPDKDMYDIEMFLLLNYQLIEDVALEKVGVEKIFENCIGLISDYCLEDINEMTKISTDVMSVKNRVLWIDEDETFQGHAPRIKFQHRKNIVNSRRFASMMLTPPYTIFNAEGSDLKKDELERIVTFVKANADNLLKVARKEMLIQEFKTIMIRVDMKGCTIPPVQSYYKDGKVNKGYQKVKNISGLVNVIDVKTDKVLFNTWLDGVMVDFMETHNGKPFFYGTRDKKVLRLYTDGTEEEIK